MTKLQYLRLSTRPVVYLLLVFCLSACSEEEPVEQPFVSTLGISGITPFEAKGGGNVTFDGGSPILSRGVVWTEGKAPTLEQHSGITTDGQGAGVFTGTLTNLAPGTDYYVRAYATNALGPGYGDVIKFSTPAIAGSLSTVMISEITSNSAVSGGEISYDGGAAILEKGVSERNQRLKTL